MNLVDLARRILRAIPHRATAMAGYAAFGGVCFVIFFYVGFPYERLRDRLISTVEQGGQWQMEVGSIGPTILPGIKLKDVVLRSVGDSAKPDPDKSNAKTNGTGAELRLSKVSVHVGLFAALAGNTSMDFSADILDGELDGSFTGTPEEKHLEAELAAIPLDSLPWFAKAVGTPIQGGLAGTVDVRLVGGKFANAEGEASFRCENCAIAQGTRLQGSGAGFMAQGMTLPALHFGTFDGTIKINKGNALFEGFEAKSDDGEASLEADIQLRDPVEMSQVRGYLRFKFSDALKKKDPKFEALEAGLLSGKRPDGSFGVRISGRLGQLHFAPSKAAPPGLASTAREERANKPWRPGANNPPPAAPVRESAPEEIPPPRPTGDESNGDRASVPMPPPPEAVPEPPPTPAPEPVPAEPVPTEEPVAPEAPYQENGAPLPIPGEEQPPESVPAPE